MSSYLTRAAIFALVLAGLPAAIFATPADPAAGIEIGFVNRVYQDLDSNLQPIHQGGMTILLSSPEHRLTVHSNRLALAPGKGGALDVVMEVDFEGGGHLIADVESIGRFEDQVEAPRQTARAAGKVRLTRAEGAYLFTVESADPTVTLAIKSGVARQIVGACRVVALILGLPCDGLDQALSAVAVPLPGPGEQFSVPADRLSAGEQAFLDRFVADE